MAEIEAGRKPKNSGARFVFFFLPQGIAAGTLDFAGLKPLIIIHGPIVFDEVSADIMLSLDIKSAFIITGIGFGIVFEQVADLCAGREG